MADKIIEFTSYDNRRNVSLFLDLVRGHAVINYKQRRQEEGADGIPVLYAEYEDYLVAATVFNAQSQYLGSRLTKDEYEAVNFIYQCPGVSINEILLHMQEFNPTGRWNSQKVRRMMEGRPDRPGGGLISQVDGMRTGVGDAQGGAKVKTYFVAELPSEGVEVKIKMPIDSSELFPRFPTFSQGGKRANHEQEEPFSPSFPNFPIIRYNEKGEGMGPELTVQNKCRWVTKLLEGARRPPNAGRGAVPHTLTNLDGSTETILSEPEGAPSRLWIAPPGQKMLNAQDEARDKHFDIYS